MAKEGSILDRAGKILASNIHAMLDKCEDKEKMLDQNMRDAVEDLAELKESAIKLRADVKSAQRAYDGAVQKIQAEHGFAVNAMKAGDEETAAKFLKSEAQIKASEVDPAEKRLTMAKKNFETVQQAHNKLANDIEIMKNSMETIKGTIRTAKATEKVAAMKDPTKGYGESFSKYAEQAQRMLDEANARMEMNTEPVDEMSTLREKYAGGMQADMSAALAGLKAECGITETPEMGNALEALRKEANNV